MSRKAASPGVVRVRFGAMSDEVVGGRMRRRSEVPTVTRGFACGTSRVRTVRRVGWACRAGQAARQRVHSSQIEGASRTRASDDSPGSAAGRATARAEKARGRAAVRNACMARSGGGGGAGWTRARRGQTVGRSELALSRALTPPFLAATSTCCHFNSYKLTTNACLTSQPSDNIPRAVLALLLPLDADFPRLRSTLAPLLVPSSSLPEWTRTCMCTAALSREPARLATSRAKRTLPA